MNIKKLYNILIVKPFQLLYGIMTLFVYSFMVAAPFITIITFANVEHGISDWFIYLCWGFSIIDFIYLANLVVSDKNKTRKVKDSEVIKIDEITYEQEEKE